MIIFLFYIANVKKQNTEQNIHLAHGKTSEGDNFYPLTHLKSHFDVLRGILNKDVAFNARKSVSKNLP